MKYSLAIFLLIPLLNGCGGSANAHNTDDNSPAICLGFGASDINIYVRDSMSDEIIDSALVQIHIEDDTQTVFEAKYVEDEDNLLNTAETAYYSELNVNESKYEYGILVTESNYHTFVTKNRPYTLNTSCGANNTVTTTIYLCQLGTACL